MSTIDGIAEKSEVLWHDVVQFAPDLIGIWLDGMTLTVKSLMLAWQLEHSPVPLVPMRCPESATLKVPAAACGRVWKPLNGALNVIGYCPMLIQTMPVSWQEAQPAVTPAWIMDAVGAGVINPLFTPAVLVDTAGTRAAGVLPKWQFSHVVEVGKCEPTPAGDVGGITMLVTPKYAEALPGP
jgi:hypothetical protein